VKFTAAGYIALRAMVREGPERPVLAVEVEDTGVGIAPGEIGKLFRPFEQTASGRQAQSGTGLGLAISLEYARLMGGGISVASELGKGSTFLLEIPIGWDKLQPAGQDPPRVLVADGDEIERGWLGDLPRAAGFEVREWADGREAEPLKEADLFQKIGSHPGVRDPHAEAGLTADSLAGLPPDLTAEMRQAILTGDMDRFTRVLPDVAARDAAVAEGLRELADRYDYDALGELLG
jgi:hypothetical protein